MPRGQSIQAPRRAVPRDPGDDYLVALAAASSAVLVSSDRYQLEMSGDLPIYSPAAFLATLDR